MRIKPSRVYDAIIALGDWCQSVNSQKAQHLWPLLALLERGIGTTAFVPFREELDFDFWNRYNRVPGDTRPAKVNDAFQDDYYIDPLSRQKRASDHPHRGPATIRVRTFANSWKAAEEKNDTWKLAPTYAQIVRSRVLSKGGDVSPCPVLDLGIWLFRDRDFPAGATAESIVKLFRETFKQTNPDFDLMFRFADEPATNIFTADTPPAEEYAKAINAALLPSVEQIKQADPVPVQAAEQALPEDDPVLLEIIKLLDLGSSGIILRGCPGTGKTWYAKRLASRLVQDPKTDIFSIQFHPSYGYEDFVEGYRPDEGTKSGFKVVDKIFLAAVAAASKKKTRVALIIDEINRGDPARVLGEVLTYVESSYRGQEFSLPYTGKAVSIPKNLVLLGTMNPHDRSIAQLDLAFLRRFDHVELKPSGDVVATFLEGSGGFTPEQVLIVKEWFEDLQKLLPFGIGHAYLQSAKSADSLKTIWTYRMWPFCETVLELDEPKRNIVRARADAMFKKLASPPAE